MSVYKPPNWKHYKYDFVVRGRRYQGNTHLTVRRDAEEFERKEQVRIERQIGDLSLRAEETPRFQDWAETFFAHKRERIKSPDRMAREIRVVLEFFGSKPAARPRVVAKRPPPPKRTVPVVAPYHDLRLGDLIDNPEWITDFEEWMRARRTGGSARNHYRSIVSGMYKVARLPQYRRATGVRSNPMEGIERDRQVRRRVTLTVEQLQSWIAHAAPHIRLALAIGALAPTLRLGSVLALEWGVHVDEDLKFITVFDHKGDRANPEPIVVPIVEQLRIILTAHRAALEATAARTGRPVPAWIVSYHRKRIGSIKKGLKTAATEAKIPYGVAVRGATFHTLRHTMATLLAELGVPDQHRKEALGHSDLATTQIYTHLRPMHMLAPLEQLSGALALTDFVVRGKLGVATSGHAGKPEEIQVQAVTGLDPAIRVIDAEIIEETVDARFAS